MRKLRWAMDAGGFWELDRETPATMEGTARPVPGLPLPLGLSRGTRLSRPKQLEFMHLFMASPLVPSYNPERGLALSHVHAFHLRDNWSASVMEQFHLRKFMAAMEEGGGLKGFSWVKNVGRQLLDACAFGVGTEVLVTPDSSLVVETYRDDDSKNDRTKAVFSHKFPQHNLTLEAAWPGLFVDDDKGTYWDVPSSMALGLASNNISDSGLSYHMCLQHNTGEAKALHPEKANVTPPFLLPGLCAKAVFSFKKSVDIWRKKGGKLKMVQPYDVFLSDPHLSASGTIGSAVMATFCEKSTNSAVEDNFHQFKSINLRSQGINTSLSADAFASISLDAQLGNFQRLLFDLSRLSARFDFYSGSALVNGATSIVNDIYNSRQVNLEAVRAICPKVTVSLQQQIAGPFSFRVESRLALDRKNQGPYVQADDSIFAIEYAMQVLGSARATAWYSPKNREAMVELRFFET